MSAHHDEQQELENAKHLWKNGGKWVFALLLAAAIGYLGKVIYQNHQQNQQEKAALLVSKMGNDATQLAQIQQQHPNSTAATQASLQMAAHLFEQGKLDEAAAAYRWVLQHNQTPIFQAAATQNLANLLLQQQKYDEALAVLSTPLAESYQAMIYELKGDVLAAQGKNQEASDAYQLALDKLPENATNRELLQVKKSSL